MTESFVGYQCWQTERIGEVISKEALTIADSEFLATHVPMRRIAYEVSPQHIPETSEAGLLDEMMRAGNANEHVFTVVKGIPGTGKSHLIRWLEIQYRLKHPRDAVLLIARADSSLRATLEQIINSRIFDLATLPEPLKRLRETVTVLSEEALADKLLNGLQVATHALDWEQVQQRVQNLHTRIKPKKVELFLLDQNVRIALKTPGGPIERITTFLSSGTGSRIGIDSIPGFNASDFAFDIQFLNRLRREGGFQEVRDFCEALHLRPELRESLARYLDFTLRQYAIRDATQLAAGDLQVMFQDLRRHLRAQNKNLALFIEDITAFTGIDEGLIEVLISRHGGQAGGDLCRLTSVVGVTDTYYADRFADNIKQRVTHVLTLNTRSGRSESELMQDSAVRAEFAARYLNAMRVSASQVKKWKERGAHEEALPNACTECVVRAQCHAAFGTVAVRDARGRETDTQIGLYPFNLTALNTLYEFLKEDLSRTPRTFLNDLLAYILTSHSALIPAGKFPPPSREFVNAVEIPLFDPPLHQRLVQDQGGADAERLETLFRFWGKRNVFVNEDDRVKYVGGLLPEVLHAFKLKTIAGAISEKPSPQEEDGKGQRLAKEDKKKEPPPPLKEREYLRQIEAWANGDNLSGYDRFVDWVADLFRAFIDWQAYGISSSQVKEYLTGSRFEIEGQNRSVQAGRLHFTFPRAPELRYVLLALAEINDSSLTLQPNQYGEHLTTLSVWARQHEPEIVAFVREPTGTVNAPNLREILCKNAVLLACLASDLDSAAIENTTELYLQVIASCAESTPEKWKMELEQARATHPSGWIALMRRVDIAVHNCRTELLQILNRPQGASSDVRYLDAAAALEILADWNDADWTLEPLSAIPETNDETWQNALRVYQTLHKEFTDVWKNAEAEIKKSMGRLDKYIGDVSAQETYDAMKQALNALRETREISSALAKPFETTGDNSFSPGRLDKLREQLAQHFKLKTQRERIIHLSSNLMTWQRDLQLWLEYFELFEKTAREQSERLKRDLDTLRDHTDADEQLARMQRLYAKTLQVLTPFNEVQA